MPVARLFGMLFPPALIAVFAWAAPFVRAPAELSAFSREVQSPPYNPATPEKIELGRLLFWDPILSGAKDVACATCHHPDFGYAENRDLSIGTHGVGLGASRRFDVAGRRPFVKRNSPTILNVAFNGLDAGRSYDPARAPMFWDVRAAGLEAQALEPVKALEEMRGEAHPEEAALSTVVSRLRSIPDYRARFTAVFGGTSPVSAANLSRALAAFERTLVATDTPFDRFMRGDRSAMTPLQVRGMERFARIGCASCHAGPMFSDYALHVLGVPDNPKLPSSDSGVGHVYQFRTPTLRNLRHTAPYMHNGMLATLDDVIHFYDDVSRGRMRNPNVRRGDIDPALRGQNAGGDRRDLVAFLEALTDDQFDRTVPAHVPSGLPVGGRIRD